MEVLQQKIRKLALFDRAHADPTLTQLQPDFHRIHANIGAQIFENRGGAILPNGFNAV